MESPEIKEVEEDKFVVAPPIVKRTEAIEFTDPGIPGEIVVDRDGKLLKKWFTYEGLFGSLVQTYNNWIINKIGLQLASQNLTLPSGIVTFENPWFVRPSIKTTNGAQVPLLPQEARQRGFNYTADLYVDLVLNKGNTNEERIDKSFLGKVPVMLGSTLDWLSSKTAKEREDLGEGIGIEEGYFLIKDQEKIILNQEKLRANKFLLFNLNTKGDVFIKITNNILTGSTQISMAQDKDGIFKIHMGFMKGTSRTNKMGNTLAVFQIFRMLGVTDPKDMIKYIALFTKPQYMKRIFVTLQPTLVELSKIGDDIEYISKLMGMGNLPYEIRKSDIIKDVTNQLFPQIDSTDIQKKLYMLSIMTVRLAEYVIGVRDLDDRDNWGNKQIVSAGKSMELLFSSIWREMIQKAQDEIDSKSLSGLKSAQRVLDSSFITTNFISSFTANKWGVQTSYMPKENITDILKRESILAVLSHLTRINTPIDRKGKVKQIRMVQLSQVGYVDAAETPEGQQCLAKGTPVLMSDKTWKPIEQIVEGDEVITVNPDTLERSPSKITQPFTFHTSTSNKKMYRLKIDGAKIEGTGDHPFLTQTGWKNLDQLSLSDKVCYDFGLNAMFIEIQSIERIDDDQVYDFTTISDNHSFIANGFVTHNCGLVKNLASTAYLSLDRPDIGILEMLGPYVSVNPTEFQPNPFMLNGIFQGWVDGPATRDYAISLRRSLKFARDTTIVLERDGFLHIYTDSSRPTRPLLIVEDGQLVIEKKDLWSADFETLLREGCVEYIDAWEQDTIMLAQSMDDVEFRQSEIRNAQRSVKEAEQKLASDPSKHNQEILGQARAVLNELSELPPYSHSELDPSAILSLAISIIPVPETNPGPRLTYQAGMGKQALGIYHSAHSSRFDTTAKVLAYPSRPLFETQMNEVLGLNDLPAGEMVTLAIATYGGFNQEDSIIMSKGAIDRGLFRSIVYKTYKAILNNTRNFEEKFVRPVVPKGKEDRYSAIGENGLPIIGSFVKQGDCIIGKVRVNKSTREVENSCSFVEIGQQGVIDRVLLSRNQDGAEVAKVKIRQIRKPILGDKFACYTPDHEILTLNRSWISIADVTKDDLVATLNDGNLVYQNPSDVQSYDYEGPMYNLETQQLSLCVTPNHRMYVKDKKKYGIQRADEMFGKNIKFRKNAFYESVNELSEFLLPPFNDDKYKRLIPMDMFCDLLSIFMSKGVVKSNVIEIYGGEKIQNKIGMICNEVDLPCSYQPSKMCIYDSRLGNYLEQFSSDRLVVDLPDWFFHLSQSNSRKIVTGLKRFQKTRYQVMADCISQLALHSGWSANVSKDEIGLYTVSINKKSCFKNKKEKWIDYTGKVHCCTVDSGIIYVRKNGKPVWCGNSRFAQKGTIGMILPEEDMPFTREGIRPDIILNPHAIPSRMTIGKLIEVVVSKLSSFTGERYNATAFRNFDTPEFMRMLKEYGYSSSGKERMTNGMDGKLMDALIFTGPCYYQVLKHQVDDKIQMRSRGGLKQLTHQPVGGRKKAGGLRVGEMERDAIIEHGASAFLRERLCLVSDAYETVYCSACGMIAISNEVDGDYVCRQCDDDAKFGKCTIPYAFKLLSQLLAGANFKISFKMDEK